MMRAIVGAVVVLTGTQLQACVTRLDPLSPSVSATSGFVGASGADVAVTALHPGWWRLFGNAELDAHVRRAIAANADLRVAVANLDVARASGRLARSAYLPATVIESGAGPERADRQPSTSSVPKTSYELGVTLAYEIDLFGRLRANTRAMRADARASAAAHDAVRAAVVSDTVSAYIDYCGAVANQRVVRDQVAGHERGLELVSHQLDQGEVSPLEQAQSRTALQRVLASLPPFEADRQRALFRLSTLQGVTPGSGATPRPACTTVPIISRAIPVSDGAALIARRPDIREAEQRLVAATARIGVATADLYPRISLGASGGLIAGAYDAILTPLLTWSFPIQSAARAKIAAARGNQAAALAAWDSAILKALSEVESALADYHAERARARWLATAAVDSERAVRAATARFRLGADSYLLVLDSIRTHNDIALQRATSDARVAQIGVALFRALGSGWEASPPDTTARSPAAD
ncbi:MAG: efflux transporter outer membrane subunit [Pseudomonadota bacterium]